MNSSKTAFAKILLRNERNDIQVALLSGGNRPLGEGIWAA